MYEVIAVTVVVLGGLVQLAGLFAAADAVMKGRTPEGTIAWALALVIFPLLALPLYLAFGLRRFHGYVRARRVGRLEINDLGREVHSRLSRHGHADSGPGYPRAFDRLGLLPATDENRVELLIDGAESYEAMFASVSRAASYVLVQFYIVRDDAVGRRLKELLVAARGRGAEVLFLYDGVGSGGLPRAFIRELEAAGVRTACFKTSKGARNPLRLNFRNHRKIVICDGREAFVGGLNIGEEYLGKTRRFGPWRDTHLRLTGPSVQAVQLAFYEDWHWATRQTPRLEWEPAPAEGSDQRVLVVPTGPADDMDAAVLLFTGLIHGARERLWLAAPYFVPDEAVVNALQLAALRGVDVRIVIPERADQWIVWFAAFSYYDEVLPYGVRVYRYQPGFMHQKVILCDNLACVGTANLDNRSLRINFEITAMVADAAFAGQVRSMLERDMQRCHAVGRNDFAKRAWGFRVAARMARLLSPIL